MMVLVALRLVQTFAGIDLGVPMEEFGADAAVQVINGPYTFFLAHALMITAPFWVARDQRARRLVQLGVVLLLSSSSWTAGPFGSRSSPAWSCSSCAGGGSVAG